MDARQSRGLCCGAKSTPVQCFAVAGVGMPDVPEGGLFGDQIESYWDDFAVWSAGLLEQDILDALKARLAEELASGDVTSEELSFDLDSLLAQYLPELDAAGRTVNLPARIENIARTNIATAVNAGRQQVFNDPDLADFLTGLRYSAVLDSRTRENHAAWDGVVRPVAYWDAKGVPPSGFNCRCLLVPVTSDDGESLTPEDELPRGPDMQIPDEGFEPRPGGQREAA